MKILTIIAVLFTVNLGAQEMVRNPYDKWLILYIEVPQGCDTTLNKDILEFQKVSNKTIDDFIKENKIKDLRFSGQKEINSEEYWTSNGYCERVVFANLSSIIRMEYTSWKREPKMDISKLDELKYDSIKTLFNNGIKKDSIEKIFYPVRLDTLVKSDTINLK